MEREVPLVCGESCRKLSCSRRYGTGTQSESHLFSSLCVASLSLCFPLHFVFTSLLLRCCCVLLRFAPLCFSLLSGSGLGSFCVFDLFWFTLLRFASFRFASFGLALLRFLSLWSASFCSTSFRSAWFCLAFALFCFILLRLS